MRLRKNNHLLKGLLIIFSLALLSLNFIDRDINTCLSYNRLENFEPALLRLTSMQKLENYVDSIAAKQKIVPGSYEYVQTSVTVIRKRFYHGFSHFTLSENWIAATSGKYIEEGLACKVRPDEILQHENAACSQQSIVMMALLRKKNIDYRKVGFPHHYALEAKIGNEWYFFDPNLEPVMTKEQRMLASWQHKNDVLKQYYDYKRCKDLDYQFGNAQMATVGPENEVPAPNARMFHSTTAVLSKIAWCFPLLLLLFMRPSPFSFTFPFIAKRKPVAPSLAG
jgi:hypothetical protein